KPCLHDQRHLERHVGHRCRGRARSQIGAGRRAAVGRRCEALIAPHPNGLAGTEIARNSGERRSRMASVDMTVTLKAPAQKVWDLVGGFDALPRWLPPIAKSEERKEGNALHRHLSLHGGGIVVEKLERRDDRTRQYSYTIESSPLPI